MAKIFPLRPAGAALLMLGALAGVLVGGVTMSLGMLVHEASVLIVIVNAMRLLRPATQARRTRRGREAPATPAGRVRQLA